MTQLSAFLFICSLVLSVLLGAQTRSWSWGPSLLAMAAAIFLAIPAFRTGPTTERKDSGLLIWAALTAAWFTWRACFSPVSEFAAADLMLLAATVGAFTITRAVSTSHRAENIFIWGIAILLGANLLVLVLQIQDSGYSAIYAERPAKMPSGFFSHYNEGANFLIGASFILAGTACFGQKSTVGRITLGFLAICGLVAVYYTRSRGGILAVAIGTAVFTIFLLINGKKQQAKWFAPLAIITPILAILGVGLLLKSWADAQEFRFASGVDTVMDNPIRLYMLGAAASCLTLHPLMGGGSRSYSWESYQFWNFESQGGSATRPEMVHNELMQAATDYGIIGALLIGTLILWIITLAFTRNIFGDKKTGISPADGWRAGGTAGLIGMLCQSSFSFVFHLLPGAILLGICLARSSAIPNSQTPGTRTIFRQLPNWILGTASLIAMVFLAYSGWKASRITRILLPSYLKSSSPTSELQRIRNLTQAIRIWPQPTFYKERAFLFQNISKENNTEIPPGEAQQQAISDYRKAIALHPFDATLTINLANLLSAAGNDDEAERAYIKTCQLEGGMEFGFMGHLSYAEHLAKKGARLLSEKRNTEALAAFEAAYAQLEENKRKAPFMAVEQSVIRPTSSVLEGLGLAKEADDDFVGALQAYDEMNLVIPNSAGHYRAASLLSKAAARAWSQRKPSEALSLFLRAKTRISQATYLPSEIKPSNKLELAAYIGQSISFLKAARITPSDLGE